MKDLPRNEASFLLSLGMQPKPPKAGMAAPPIHRGSDPESDMRHIREASSTGQMETATEIDANTKGLRSIGERANTRKARWQTVV